MAKWQADSARRIKRRYVIIGKLVLDTPASIGSGENDGSELVILEDALEHRPLIPGASLAGALRHYLLTREKGYRVADLSDKDSKTFATLLFGEALDNNKQQVESRVIVSDSLGVGALTRREGVKIEAKTRTADEGMLFSSQVWESGTTFDLRFELVLYNGDPDELLQAFAASLLAFSNGEIPIGGRKYRGYGRLHVEDWQVCFYDLKQPAALSAWLLDELYGDATQIFFQSAQGWTDRRHFVRIEATLQLCDSLLIRASSDLADNEQLTSKDQPVLSGTSLAGALRARALKIANTIKPKLAINLIDDLFGRHGGEDQKDNLPTLHNEKDNLLTASRLLVEEHPIRGGTFGYIQNRVKIDRFTGGAFETALFSERPLFANGDTSVQVNFELRYPADSKQHGKLDAQTGLLLLVLKDLWTEDLPLGGEASIGRGRLHGQSAIIYLKSARDIEPSVITLNERGVLDSQYVDDIERYVRALWDYRGEAK